MLFRPKFPFMSGSVIGAGSAAAPISMAIAEENGFINDGERVILFGVGSGINTMVFGIEW